MLGRALAPLRPNTAEIRNVLSDLEERRVPYVRSLSARYIAEAISEARINLDLRSA